MIFTTTISRVIFLILFFLCASPTFAINLGTVGVTYEIAEEDALAAFQERAEQVNWNNIFSREKTEKLIREYKPKGLVSLPRASENRTFHVDMTYTLEFDIPDGKGGILYPKGYTFNPLDYVQMPTVLVIINGDDPDQVKWFKESGYDRDFKAMLLLVSGSYSDLAEKLDRPVFYADERITGKFRIKAVPSVVRQDGAFMSVREFKIQEPGS
ncbi:MAG: hypothetical protein JXB42_11600 [Deltaproteobacteria bacterium]|nr:hypothetical protein [Deltaproteobacteria bacterium]